MDEIRFKDVFAASFARRLPHGDKILLPPSALQTLLDATAQAQRYARPDSLRLQALSAGDGELPQPLTFRLVNTANQKAVFAGIREFSADEGQVVLSDYLRAALGLEEDRATVASGDDRPAATIAVAFHPLPKGTFVHLRPLEAGYNPADWRALLERQLREGFTTLTQGAELSVRGNDATEKFRLRIDGFRPEGPGICVVDTDLEVDIEALDEAQALETVRQIQSASTSSSAGGKLDIFKLVDGQVRAGDYVDYELPSWDRSRPLEITLSGLDVDDVEPGYAVDLLVSPRSARQRALPRETEHVWANFDLSDPLGVKSIRIEPTDAGLDGAEALLISVSGWKTEGAESVEAAHPYSLRARVVLEEEMSDEIEMDEAEDAAHFNEDEQCQNCLQWVPSRSMILHENFCRRNNAVCRQCRRVFQTRSDAWKSHWHCALDPTDGGRGNSSASHDKHNALFHAPRTCPGDSCIAADLAPYLSISDLARHRATVCPSKRILCQFCHLEVPQEGDPTDPSDEAATVLTGMTPHERTDGARTTECYRCDAIVRMRDMRAHLQHHDLDRQRRVAPTVCHNALCGRTRYGVGPRGQIKGPPADGGNPIGLCGTCFSPLYVSTHDPDGRALRRRIERRYLSQLLTGCGRSWCGNEWCKTGRQNQKMEPLGGESAKGTAALLPLVKPLVTDATETARPTHFCVDETNQQRRAVAEMLAAQGRFELPWCVAAVEAEGPDATRAWEWLSSWAAEGQDETEN